MCTLSWVQSDLDFECHVPFHVLITMFLPVDVTLLMLYVFFYGMNNNNIQQNVVSIPSFFLTPRTRTIKAQFAPGQKIRHTQRER